MLFFLLGNGLVVWALQFMPSGTASIFVVAVGIWTAVFDALLPGGPGRITMRVGVGLVMAFVGSVLLVGTSAAQILHADLRGPLALTVASMAWAMGTVLMKRRPSPANPVRQRHRADDRRRRDAASWPGCCFGEATGRRARPPRASSPSST